MHNQNFIQITHYKNSESKKKIVNQSRNRCTQNPSNQNFIMQILIDFIESPCFHLKRAIFGENSMFVQKVNTCQQQTARFLSVFTQCNRHKFTVWCLKHIFRLLLHYNNELLTVECWFKCRNVKSFKSWLWRHLQRIYRATTAVQTTTGRNIKATNELKAILSYRYYVMKRSHLTGV